ncbi:hypothetical protein [Neorhizobium tomejilense]|uniref:hypothetical protein n=1 Tax=Neorhizobium tomejilense TaxID=2093828 RepID=UPI003ECDDFB2
MKKFIYCRPAMVSTVTGALAADIPIDLAALLSMVPRVDVGGGYLTMSHLGVVPFEL